MIKGLVIIVIGILLISITIVDIWPFLPGRLGAKFSEDAKRDQERHPGGYWFGRMLMMAIGAWVIVMGLLTITT